jgi:hypothetical protein
VGSRFTVLMTLVSVFAVLMAMPVAFRAVHKGSGMPKLAVQLKEMVTAHAASLSGDEVPIRLSSGSDVAPAPQPAIRTFAPASPVTPAPAAREITSGPPPTSTSTQTVAVCPPGTYYLPPIQRPPETLTIGGGGACLSPDIRGR